MGRWESGTAERLQQAAMGLFEAHGFENTTAAQIAEAAGLTQRTFFRYFADKRDVLFGGQAEYLRSFTDAIAAAPSGSSPLQLVSVALTAAAARFPEQRRGYARRRQAVIDADLSLRERERHKSAGLAVEVGRALHERGIPEPTATLAAESAATTFGVAFRQWATGDDDHRSLTQLTMQTLATLSALHTGSSDNHI